MRKIINIGLLVTLVWGGIFAYQHHKQGDLEEKWPWFYVVMREVRDVAYYRYGMEPPPDTRANSNRQDEYRMKNPSFAKVMDNSDGIGVHYRKDVAPSSTKKWGSSKMTSFFKQFRKRRGR